MNLHTTAPQRELNILLVEDERDVLDMLSEIICAEGYRAHAAMDGAEALERFAREPFDIVFTDMNMPGLSGFEVAKGVKRLCPGVPVVLLTGWDVDIEPAELQTRGVDRLIKKPFAITDILSAITALCR